MVSNALLDMICRVQGMGAKVKERGNVAQEGIRETCDGVIQGFLCLSGGTGQKIVREAVCNVRGAILGFPPRLSGCQVFVFIRV